MKPFEAMTVDDDGFPLDRGTPPEMNEFSSGRRDKIAQVRARIAAGVQEVRIVFDKTVDRLLPVVVDGFGG